MAFDPVSAIFGVAEKVLERVWPDPTQKAAALQAMAELKQKGELAFLDADVQLLTGQLEINKMEAQHGGRFKGGWRPFIGWVCGLAFAYHFIVRDFIVSIVQVATFYAGDVNPETGAVIGVFPVSLLPQLDTATLMTILMGMLGLGGLRTYEKRKTQQSVSG